jgi:hypothetical protein
VRLLRAIASIVAGGIVCMLGLPAPAAAQGPAGRLDFADSLRMMNCDPAAAAPCFRLKFNIVDAQGNPLGAQLPAPDKLADSIAIRVDGQEIKPFYAVAEGGVAQATRNRTALVLIDISGSMNTELPSGGTRFEAAKAALSHFLDNFHDNADQVAIIPFESHDVESTIRAAHFASTRDEALRQVNSLPAPQPRNNTALFSAVLLGLDVLKKHAADSGPGALAPETMLIVMTDGSNDVERGDDPGLLAGSSVPEEVSGGVQASGIQVIAVGFGDRKDIDETALRHLSTRLYMPDSAEQLKQIFSFARTLLNNRIRAAFASPYPDRSSLAGRTMVVSARLTLASGESLASGDKAWETPQLGVPLYEGKCDGAEMKALLRYNALPGGGWMAVLRPVLVFLGLGTLLLVLWFWIPRLVWPEQYIGVVGAPNRWAEAGRTFSVKARPPAPAGFETVKNNVRPPPRAPGDATVVQQRPDFSKTRLQKRPDQEEKR